MIREEKIKIVKKGLSFLLVLAMLAAMVCIPVAAVDPAAVTVISDKTAAKKGNHITVTVKVGAVESVSDISGIETQLHYDPTKRTYVEKSEGPLGKSFGYNIMVP